MRLVYLTDLPEAPLAAAAAFHAGAPLPDDDDLLLVFAPADYRHRGWRAAAVADLARAAAPRRRVNAVAGDDPAAITAAAAYLASAAGITGQLLALNGHGAGAVVETDG